MIEKFKFYPLTYSIIGINIVVYIFSAVLSQNIADMDMQTLVDMGALYGPYTVLKGEWWRLFTAMFLHGGMTHILMNMFSLYLIGRGVEIYFEKKAYVSIYLFSGLLGGLASLYMHPQSVGIGASGAIFGVFGALAGFFLAHRDKIATESKAFMKDFGIVLGLNLVLGLSMPSIDVSAHIGGLIVGVIGGFVISKNSKWVWAFSLVMVLIMFAVIEYLPHHYVQILT
jgi:rhomboid protease GluP